LQEPDTTTGPIPPPTPPTRAPTRAPTATPGGPIPPPGKPTKQKKKRINFFLLKKKKLSFVLD